MDKKGHRTLTDEQIDTIAAAIAIRVCSEWDRLLSGIEDEIYSVTKEVIQEELKK